MEIGGGTMHKLGEQWIEVIDGQEHMVKCVERHSKFEFYCGGCFFNGHLGECLYHSQDCPIGEVEHGYIKDLGILRNGKLPSSFGVYPTTSAPEDENEPWCLYAWIAENGKIIKEVKAWGETEQQAIDAWNRRV
jgi:hypothetical protein